MGEGFGIHTSVKAAEAELAVIQKHVDVATLAALKKVQATAKTSVRSSMRGRPRWDRRGKTGNGGAPVNLDLTPHHVSKGGGPGQLTGSLRRGVGGVKRPKKIPGGFQGGVGVGGKKTVANIYRKQVEDKFPFLAPGIKKAEKKFPIVWEKAWAKATETKK